MSSIEKGVGNAYYVRANWSTGAMAGGPIGGEASALDAILAYFRTARFDPPVIGLDGKEASVTITATPET